MNKVLSVCSALVASTLLFGCSLNQPTPAMTHHLLDHQQQELSQALPESRIAISRVKLTDYLLQPNLVMRLANNQLNLANYHHWAEPLDKAVQRIVINNLNQKDNQYGFVNRCGDCPQVNIVVEHFYPNEQGQVMLSGYFTVSKDKQQDKVEYFSFTDEQISAGYGASVVLMRRLLDQLSEQIHRVVTE